MGGAPFVIECQPGQYINKVHVWSGLGDISAIQFVTNTGMETARFGGKGGTRHTIDAKNKRICGVKGL